jgi:DNA-binding Lrp family transcriptional regulator
MVVQTRAHGERKRNAILLALEPHRHMCQRDLADGVGLLPSMVDKRCRRLYAEGVIKGAKGVYHSYYVLREGNAT